MDSIQCLKHGLTMVAAGVVCWIGAAVHADDAVRPKSAPRVMMITWDTFDEQDMQMYAENGIDTVFKVLGATEWSKVEAAEGKYDFADLRRSLGMARDAGLKVIPTISLCSPPEWFTARYPDSVLKFSDGTTHGTSPLSLAWLAESHRRKNQSGEAQPGYDAFERYMQAVLDELQQWDNVTGVALPWQLFAGDRFYSGTWDEIKEAPQDVELSGFDTFYRQRWDSSQGGQMPATWQDYKQMPQPQQAYWQQWAEGVNVDAANILLAMIHDQAPDYWIVIRKHLWIKTTDPDWMVPDLATIALLNERNFQIFLAGVKAYSDEKGWQGIIFDNDAFMDSSKIANSLETKKLVEAKGFSFMGEGEIEEGWQDRLISNIKTVKPVMFSFIPYPGKKGEQIKGEKEQEMIRLIHEQP